MSVRAQWPVLLAAALLLVPTAARAESIAVIINKSSSVEGISLAELRRIYEGQKTRWGDGSSIMVVNRSAASAIRSAFYRLVLNADPAQKFYQKGSPIPFKTINQESDIATRRLVARMPNAIGYIGMEQVDDTVKVVAIDGIRPAPDLQNADAYPLQW
jgi:phosphate transport system substrate-binding protein